MSSWRIASLDPISRPPSSAGCAQQSTNPRSTSSSLSYSLLTWLCYAYIEAVNRHSQAKWSTHVRQKTWDFHFSSIDLAVCRLTWKEKKNQVPAHSIHRPLLHRLWWWGKYYKSAHSTSYLCAHIFLFVAFAANIFINLSERKKFKKKIRKIRFPVKWQWATGFLCTCGCGWWRVSEWVLAWRRI